jgi:hypothetical protein
VAVFVEYDGKRDPQLDVAPDKSRALIDWWNKNCPRNQVGDTPYYKVGKNGKPEDEKDGSDVLVAEQLFLSSQIALVQAEATRLSDVVALFQALGGGWWNPPDAVLPDPAAAVVAAQPD